METMTSETMESTTATGPAMCGKELTEAERALARVGVLTRDVERMAAERASYKAKQRVLTGGINAKRRSIAALTSAAARLEKAGA